VVRIAVVFVGPAGAGKSSLVGAYSRWLAREHQENSLKVNLDPAADYVPYVPDFDVRKLVNVRDVALKYRLDPNGALVKSIELIAEMLPQIASNISSKEADVILVDTPGQMEVFVFRDIAPKLIRELKTFVSRLVGVFVADASLIKNPEDYAFVAVMSAALQVKLGVDVIPVINKCDLVGEVSVVGDVVSDVNYVMQELSGRGTYGEMMAEVLKVVWRYAKASNVPKVSARTLDGIEDLHKAIHEVACGCGDLT